MIEVYNPFWLPMVFVLVGVFTAWVLYGLRGRHGEGETHGGRIFRCASCGKVYGEAKDRPFAECPRCGQFNEALKRHTGS
jgi:uncharacterized C2H2 Zn-finger protein